MDGGCGPDAQLVCGVVALRLGVAGMRHWTKG